MLAIIDASPRGDGGTVFVQSAQGVSRDPGTDAGLPQVTFAIEHYGRLVRAMEKNVPVKLELDIKNSFQDDNPQSFNVVARDPRNRQGGRDRDARRRTSTRGTAAPAPPTTPRAPPS